MLPVIAGVCIGNGNLYNLCSIHLATSGSRKSESFISNLKNAHFSIESNKEIDPDRIHKYSHIPVMVKLCHQTFGTEIAKIPSQNVLSDADILFCRHKIG